MMLDKLNINQIKDKQGWLNEDSINYLAIVGSHSYGGATEDSDYDFYGFAVPPVPILFPHTTGHIYGFDDPLHRFEQWEKMHLQTDLGETDITIYNIAKYFKLVTDCNPNMIHSLFVPEDCIVKQDKIGKYVRDNRQLFISRRAFPTFMGMSKSHLHKIKNRTRKPEGNRAKLIEDNGYDTKDASYCIRLIKELEELMTYGTLTIDSNGELIKKIRHGYYTLEEVLLMYNETNQKVQKMWDDKNSYLHIYGEPDTKKIKELLIDCLRLAGYPLTSIGFKFYY